jgi:ribose transport system permease protein
MSQRKSEPSGQENVSDLASTAHLEDSVSGHLKNDEQTSDQQSHPVSRNRGWFLLLKRLWRTQAVMTGTVLLIMMLFFTALFPAQFPTPFNLEHLIIDYSGIAILGVGLTFCMTSAQFDLSVGAVLVLSSVLGVKAMEFVGGGNWLTILAGFLAAIATGLLAGFFNGWLIVKARVPSIIVTLGSLSVAQGLSYIITGGRDLNTVPELLVNTIGFGRLFGVFPYVVLVALIVVIVGTVTLSMTRFGRYTAAVGSNIEAARRAGINVGWVVIRLYLISGSMAGLAGFMSLARFNATALNGHTQDNLTALLGVVLGGTSLFGGSGTVAGTTIGIFIPAVLSNGLILMNIFPYWQFVVIGLVLISVVYIDLVKRRTRD